MRTDLGRRLARESAVAADVIVPIPDSGVCAAMGYADEANIPLRMGLIRNHYVGRTFIEPQQSIRHFGVRVKLNPVKSILDGKPIDVFNNGQMRRDFTYIDDVTESLVKILNNLVEGKFNNEIFNIGGGKPNSINDLISIIEKLSGMQVKVNIKDSNLQDVAKTDADYNKLLKLTGYVPNTDLESGIRKTLEWVTKNGFESKLTEWVKSSI